MEDDKYFTPNEYLITENVLPCQSSQRDYGLKTNGSDDLDDKTDRYKSDSTDDLDDKTDRYEAGNSEIDTLRTRVPCFLEVPSTPSKRLLSTHRLRSLNQSDCETVDTLPTYYSTKARHRYPSTTLTIFSEEDDEDTDTLYSIDKLRSEDMASCLLTNACPFMETPLSYNRQYQVEPSNSLLLASTGSISFDDDSTIAESACEYWYNYLPLCKQRKEDKIIAANDENRSTSFMGGFRYFLFGKATSTSTSDDMDSSITSHNALTHIDSYINTNNSIFDRYFDDTITNDHIMNQKIPNIQTDYHDTSSDTLSEEDDILQINNKIDELKLDYHNYVLELKHKQLKFIKMEQDYYEYIL